MGNLEDRVDFHRKSVIRDLSLLWKGEDELTEEDKKQFCDEYGWDEYDEENRYEVRTDYALEFSYISPKCGPVGFGEGYFRYLCSRGRPSEEFRIFVSGPEHIVHRVEFWLLDWSDGAHRTLTPCERDILETIFEDFRELGYVSDVPLKMWPGTGLSEARWVEQKWLGLIEREGL